jgi:hypothetical protein
MNRKFRRLLRNSLAMMAFNSDVLLFRASREVMALNDVAIFFRYRPVVLGFNILVSCV